METNTCGRPTRNSGNAILLYYSLSLEEYGTTIIPTKEKPNELGQHGFARDMDFQLSYEEEDAVVFSLESNAETLDKYPFPFVLGIGYLLKGKHIDVIWNVQNIGDEEMHFQIGAHPAFYYRDFNPQDEVHAYIGIGPDSKGLQYICPVEKGCVSPERHTLNTQEGLMEIGRDTFACDTYIFDNSQVNELVLCDKAKKPYLSMQFNTPLVAIWSPSAAHPDVPFICLEPWYGRCDRVGYDGELKDREWIQHLQPGKGFTGGYTITLEDI